jgi:hypothetical protein
MTSPSGEQLRQLVEGTFVGPVASRHDTPSVAVIPIDWNAYDVPRMWDALRREADELAWLQQRGFENLAQLLLSQHDKLKGLRNDLADCWDPQTNQSAVNVFVFLDELIAAIAEDAVAHACTSRGLDGILATLTTAREQLGQIKHRWDNVTTDLVPEWWDHEADHLNAHARQIIATADQTTGDHRRQITVPYLYQYPTFVAHLQPPTTTPDPHRQTRDTRRIGETNHTAPTADSVPQAPIEPPPAVPGYQPAPGLGPDLQALPGVPRLVPAVPGSPVSVLPVPPGNPYAPGGGAYVLPGPGIGRGGWIYPMPPTPSAAAPATAGGFVPATTGGEPPRQAQRPGRGHGELVWEVARGVPPVIGGDMPASDEQADRKHQLDQLRQEAFVDWFADVATPWANDLTVTTTTQPRSKP